MHGPPSRPHLCSRIVEGVFLCICESRLVLTQKKFQTDVLLRVVAEVGKVLPMQGSDPEAYEQVAALAA